MASRICAILWTTTKYAESVKLTSNLTISNLHHGHKLVT